MKVVIFLWMVDYVRRGSWTNDIDTIAPEEQLVVKRVKEDGRGMELPQDQVLECSYPAQCNIRLSGGKEALAQTHHRLLYGATLDTVHGHSVRQLHGKLLAQDGVGGTVDFDTLSEAGDGKLLHRVGKFGHDDAAGMHGCDHGKSAVHPSPVYV